MPRFFAFLHGIQVFQGKVVVDYQNECEIHIQFEFEVESSSKWTSYSNNEEKAHEQTQEQTQDQKEECDISDEELSIFNKPEDLGYREVLFPHY